MPVDVGVALVGTKGEDVHPLGTDLLAHCLRDPVDEPVQPDVLLHSEVARHLLAVLFGGDQVVVTK